jgi:peptidoglycan/LPS O-acetylase OafA/YrhL
MVKMPEMHPHTYVMETDRRAKDISTDLTWVDMLKGMAIVGVLLENWTNYVQLAATPALAHSLVKVLPLATGPCVQVFFILSGFGLTTTYLKQGRANWSWQRWTWRRITKIVVPYEVVLFSSFVLGILGSHLYEAVRVRFSWSTLLAYLTFTRNFCPPSWTWNPSLWFMPVIIGLYVCFPMLLRVLDKWGPWGLLSVSVVITYGSLTIAALAGYTGAHDSALFAFWLLPFALGIILAYERETSPQRLRFLIGPWAFILGVVFMMCAWALRTYVPLGNAFNDSVTSVGVFLVLLNLGWAFRAAVPAGAQSLNALSSKSYLMYLVHYPIMMFLIGPLFGVPLHPILAVILGGVYILGIFYFCHFISKPMNRLTSRLYNYR